MKAKKLTGLVAILALLLTLTTTSFATYSYEETISPPADNVSQIIGDGNTVIFIDVPSNHWAKDQIDYFAQQGIIDGYTDGSFKPEAGVTREEFCKLLVSTFKQPLETPSTPTFSDVPENRWSYPYVEVCRDFLTGYANPFGGMPSFHPTEYATREDIAVALVRMMGFTDKDASNPNYAAYNFRDGGNISPNILAYVSIACERGLISGYPDGTFGPTKGITRAETVVLLNRATKQAVTNINAELEISANVIYSSDKKAATINIIAEEGTTVTVNGESVKMSSNYYGEYEGNYVYKFEAEGSKDFVVEGKRAGKTKKLNVTAKYEIGAPTLTITSFPTSTDKETVTIKGTVSDVNDSARDINVTVNGTIAYNSYGSWSKELSLKEGENTITIVATNSLGKSTTETRTITFGVGAPTLTITNFPTTTDKKTITIKGTVSDVNDSKGTINVTVNGNTAYNSYGSWSKELSLKEGENTITIVATNSLGKSTTETRTITFGVGAPTLTITNFPTTTDSDRITIKGTVSDVNDSKGDINVTVNGNTAYNSYGSWSKELSLKEGENTITIVASNSLGKSTTETRTITLNIGTPEISFVNCPESTTNNSITIKGKIKGTNKGAMLFVNDVEISVNSNGDFTKTYTLKEGENTFKFRAGNDYGKEATVTKTITYTPESETTTDETFK